LRGVGVSRRSRLDPRARGYKRLRRAINRARRAAVVLSAARVRGLPAEDFMRVTTTMMALSIAAAAVLASGCATHAYMPQPPAQSQGQGAPGAVYGTVQGVEVVRAQQQTTGQGAILGGLIGAVIGRQIGHAGNGRDGGTLVGAVGGAIIGNEIERQQRGAHDFQRASIRLDDGRVQTVDLPRGVELRVGERVRIERGEVVRVS
jgi:outer membrane lipoprotein SlyB